MEEQMELFEDGGLKDEGGMVDEESGNDVPSGSTKKEVRDDIPAMLSEGEFVLPADVVRYHGLEKIMQLRDEAKFGLKKMEAMGQMGNSDEATLDDDVPFGPADLLIVAGEPEEEPREMAEGGVVKAQAGTFVQPATGIMGYQPSIYQGQQTSTTYTPPPSSVAPPTPTPSPAGGYIPKFVSEGVTPFDDGSLASQPATTTPSTTDTSAVSTASTENKFVPEVQDKYTTLKYINKETGEIRDFYFYNGNPVTPIPDGFIPYDESVDETVDNLESTTVETTQVRESDDDGPDLPTAEPVDYTTFTNDELRAAFEENSNARLALTAMGVVNPMIALFGRFATGQQQKNILAEMEARGIKIPETKGNIIDRISDMISGIFNKDKEEVKKTVVQSQTSVPSYSIPNTLTDDDMGLPSGPIPVDTTSPNRTIFQDAVRDKLEEDRETQRMLDELRSKSIQATASTSAVQERAKETGMTPVQTVAKATSKNDDKPTFTRDDYDPRGSDQRGTSGTNSSKVATVNKAANTAAAKAVKEQQAAGKTESISQKIQRGGGFKQGGLATRKKKK